MPAPAVRCMFSSSLVLSARSSGEPPPSRDGLSDTHTSLTFIRELRKECHDSTLVLELSNQHLGTGLRITKLIISFICLVYPDRLNDLK